MILPRFAAIPLAWLLLVPVDAAERAVEPVDTQALPIVLAMPSGRTQEQLPALTLCRLPDGYAERVQQARGGHADPIPTWLGLEPESVLLARLLAAPDRGDCVKVPCDDRDTVALVTIPAEARPVDLIRNGRGFTVVCDALLPPFVRHDEPVVPMRQVFAVSLGRLAAGTYRCDIAITWRERHGADSPFFTVSHVARGSLPFSVLDTAAQDGPAKPPALPSLGDDALVIDRLVASKPGQPMWQIPHCETRPLADTSLADSGLMGIGGIDLARLGSDPIAVPAVAPVDATGATEGTLVAEIVGPTLDSGQWVRLRSVEMALGTWTVTVETWRDSAGRDKNIRHAEVLLVPLELPAGGLTQAPRVEVRWRYLMAKEPGGGYREIIARDQAAHDPAEPEAATRNAEAHGQHLSAPLSNTPISGSAPPVPDHARSSAPPAPQPTPRAGTTNDF